VSQPRIVADIPHVAPSDIDYIGHNKGRCVRWYTRYSVTMADLFGRELDDNYVCPLTDYLRFRGNHLQVKVTCLVSNKGGKRNKVQPVNPSKEVIVNWT